MKHRVHLEQVGGIYIAFLDLQKAFDSIPRKVVQDSLKKRGVNETLTKCIRNVYKKNKKCGRMGGLQTNEFFTKDGLRQGRVLSPTLINVVMGDVIKQCKEQEKKH